MSTQIDSARYLRQFVNFAKAQENNLDAIARFSNNNPNSRKVVVTTGDHIRKFSNFWACHGEENASANNQIRQHFILNVLKCLGCTGLPEDRALTQTEITDAVNRLLPGRGNKARRTALLNALQVQDYGRGRPLTSRRISATMEQVKAIVESRAPEGDLIVEGNRRYMTGDTAELLTALMPDMTIVATPMGDDEPEVAKVVRGGNPPSSNNDPIEFENPGMGDILKDYNAQQTDESLRVVI